MTIPVKAKPHIKDCVDAKSEKLAIVPPHLLTSWLLHNGYITFDETKAHEYWLHHRSRKVAWMSGPEEQHPGLSKLNHLEPVALYADEAEYTASKEKLTVLFLSILVVYVYSLFFK